MCDVVKLTLICVIVHCAAKYSFPSKIPWCGSYSGRLKTCLLNVY